MPILRRPAAAPATGATSLPGPLQQLYQSDPRLKLAQALTLQGQSTAPVSSPLEGLARVGQAGLGAWQQGTIEQGYQERGGAYQKALADALTASKQGLPAPYANAGATGYEAMASVLGANPDTAELGLELGVKGMGQEAELAQALRLAEEKRKAEPPELKTVDSGGEQITYEIHPDGTRVEIARGPRWNPNPAASTVIQNYPQPMAIIGPDGQPMMAQFGNKGEVLTHPGMLPYKEKTEKALPAAAANKLAEQGETATRSAGLVEGFKEEYGGNALFGDWENTFLRVVGDPSGQAQWWQDYQDQANVVRNKLFGSALTVPEKAEWEKATITPRMNPNEIIKNLRRRAELEANALQKLQRGWAAGGYSPEQIEAFSGQPITDPGAPPPGDPLNVKINTEPASEAADAVLRKHGIIK